jgi:pimeloyl-ACP methyl ester carboxylesterase
MLTADLFGRDRSPAIANFNVPALVIASERSSRSRENWPDSFRTRIEVLENAAHALFVDDPEQFERLVRRFLAIASA